MNYYCESNVWVHELLDWIRIASNENQPLRLLKLLFCLSASTQGFRRWVRYHIDKRASHENFLAICHWQKGHALDQKLEGNYQDCSSVWVRVLGIPCRCMHVRFSRVLLAVVFLHVGSTFIFDSNLGVHYGRIETRCERWVWGMMSLFCSRGVEILSLSHEIS
jgi:hypothetical protein